MRWFVTLHSSISYIFTNMAKKTLFTLFMNEDKNDDDNNNNNSNFPLALEMSDQDCPRSISKEIGISSPESPWTLSPLRTPSPSLLYHCIASLRRRDGNLHSIAVSKGVVFAGSEGRRIRVWRQSDCTERGQVKSSSGRIRTVIAHGNTFFTAHEEDRKIRVWSFAVLHEAFRCKKLATLPKQGAFRKMLARTTTLATTRSSRDYKDLVSCMAYYHAEGLLYTGSFDRTVRVWCVSGKECVDSFVAHEESVNAILVKQDDGFVFTCSSDGSVKIWRRVYRHDSHTLTTTLQLRQSPVNALALISSLTSCFLYSGASDGTIHFWERERNPSTRYNYGGFLEGHRFAILCLAAMDKLVFSGSEDTTIRVWRREEGSFVHECLAVLEGHRGPVRCLAAYLEMDKVVLGFLLYSASLDQTLKVWRIKVSPEDINSGLDFGDMSSDMSPVLSPSWVEMKMRTSCFH